MDCRPLNARDDAELLYLYLEEGDESAITVLYLLYRPLIYRFALARLSNHEEARDVVQDTWEAILTWKALSCRVNFRTLVFKIAGGLVVREWRFRSTRARAVPALQDLEGQFPPGRCRYCDQPARAKGLCKAHEWRRRKGASEAEMRKPIRPKKKNGE